MALSQDFVKYLEDLLQTETGSNSGIRKISAVSGGDVNRSYRLETWNESYFVKINNMNSYPEMFRLEAEGLETLGNVTPEVLSYGSFGSEIFLLLEWIEAGSNSKTAQQNLGTMLAKVHQKTNTGFGLSYDNYIATLSQPNRQGDNWADFFIENRLNDQLRLATEKGLIGVELQKSFKKLFERIPDLYPVEPPSLIHGDMWSGNYLIAANSKPVLIDPAIYYGHREMDIAMTTLFGGFSPEFYGAYHEQFPLEKGWQQRLSLWNLYPLLVHVNLFGSTYLPQLTSCLQKWK